MAETVHIGDMQGKRVHFIGIGGSSMNSLAQILHRSGYTVTGSDMRASSYTKHLASLGIPVSIGHHAPQVEGADLVVYTAAIFMDNPELVRAQQLGIPCMDRAQLLGQIMGRFHTAVGVTGTHGKTTTTSLLATVFEVAGVDPDVHIGGTLDLIGGGFKMGSGTCMIVEACEFNASFLKLQPTIAVLLNIDNDHMEYYKTLDNLQDAFAQYAALVPERGLVVGVVDDPRVRAVLESCPRRTQSVSMEGPADWSAAHIEMNALFCPRFDVYHHGTLYGHACLSIPGRHHVWNALCAIAVANEYGLDKEKVLEGLHIYRGAHRRYEELCRIDGVSVINDYAHHPTEIQSVLRIAKARPHRRLIAVMQPHTYSRTKLLFNDFLSTFDDADEVVLTDIYAARERDPGGIHATMLVDALNAKGKPTTYTPTFEDAAQYLHSVWHSGDVIVTVGCGPVDELCALINERYAK